MIIMQLNPLRTNGTLARSPGSVLSPVVQLLPSLIEENRRLAIRQSLSRTHLFSHRAPGATPPPDSAEHMPPPPHTPTARLQVRPHLTEPTPERPTGEEVVHGHLDTNE